MRRYKNPGGIVQNGPLVAGVILESSGAQVGG